MLLTTTNKTVDDIITLVNKLNIKSNVVVGNQFKENSVNSYFVNGYKITVVNTKEKGCSGNRNHILNYSSSDMVLFADDDEIFTDDYYSIIVNVFENNKDAEAIYFKVVVNKESRPVRMFNSNRRARWKDISVSISVNLTTHIDEFDQLHGSGHL